MRGLASKEASRNQARSSFSKAAEQLFAAVNKGLFLVDTAKIQKEASEQFQAETSTMVTALSDEIALLEGQRRYHPL